MNYSYVKERYGFAMGIATAIDRPNGRALRSILGSFATGVAVVTTRDSAGQPMGVTANSFTSVSMVPPLISWCLRSDSYSLPAFRHSRRFAINILGSAHGELCRRFAFSGPDKWGDLVPKLGVEDCPLIGEAIATLECELVAEHEAGDHTILIGRVDRAIANEEAPPLVFFRGRFYDLRSPDVSMAR
jgi:flavin reductase (DIM6/NTAB) family NADH-FMN oxidoreductase RutF